MKGSFRRSLDLSSLDDIPEERAVSMASSEEKEITRVDSGLGEWDSESSRKTSFSSQGRLSPDFVVEKSAKVSKTLTELCLEIFCFRRLVTRCPPIKTLQQKGGEVA